MRGRDPSWPAVLGENRRPLFISTPSTRSFCSVAPWRSSSPPVLAGWLSHGAGPAHGTSSASAMANPGDQEFLQHAEACMQAILAKLDAFDPDELEADLSAGVLRITFADSRNCILNRQSAAHQIWLAEGASAWHFARDPVSGAWNDTKGRGGLPQILNGILSRRLGRAVDLAVGSSGRDPPAPGTR